MKEQSKIKSIQKQSQTSKDESILEKKNIEQRDFLPREVPEPTMNKNEASNNSTNSKGVSQEKEPQSLASFAGIEIPKE